MSNSWKRNKIKARKLNKELYGAYTCVCCGGSPLKRARRKLTGEEDTSKLLSVDHIVPRSLGGGNNLANLQVMCIRCNLSKGNKLEQTG